MTMQELGAVAEFERDFLVARTQSGLKRAKAEGKTLGRPNANDTTAAVQGLKVEGMSQSEVASELRIGIATVKRHWNRTKPTVGPIRRAITEAMGLQGLCSERRLNSAVAVETMDVDRSQMQPGCTGGFGIHQRDGSTQDA